MSGTASINLTALWLHVVEQVKTHIVRPSLWRAMEAARPVTLEDDTFVIGFRPEHAVHAGLLADAQTRNFIERVLEAAMRRRLSLRVIDGETLGDWLIVKQQEEAAAALRQQSQVQRLQKSENGQSWEAVSEQLTRLYSSYPNRALPSVQGRFLSEAIAVLTAAYVRLMPAKPSDHEERTYSRVLERVAERAAVPSTLVAYLVHERLQHSR